MEITKENFKTYRILEDSGCMNMLDVNNGCVLTGLSKDEYKEIIRHYSEYKEKFNI